MARMLEGLRLDGTQRVIDWAIFGAGAASLILAVALTFAGMVAPADLAQSPMVQRAEAG